VADGRAERPGRRGGEPTPLGESLDDVRAELELASPAALADVERVWRACVPAPLHAAATVRSLHGGRLTVATADHAVASQLRYAVDAARAAIADRLGPGVVSEIVVVVDPREPRSGGPC
jgi:hypothetical protein